MNYNLVIYSHTSFLDILKIQTDYISSYENKTLFINETSIDISEFTSKYDRVLFYNDQEPYGSRLKKCIEKLDQDYFLLMHDNDILIDCNKKFLSNLFNIMPSLNIDRIDLKHSKLVEGNEIIHIEENKDLVLVKQNEITSYLYNVNPSIWNKTVFLEILEKYKDRGYRNIENMAVQIFCSKFNIYKFHQRIPLKCGYFECIEPFKFLHITHSGYILPFNIEFKTEMGQSYIDLSKDFIKIIEKYSLKNSKKWRR